MDEFNALAKDRAEAAKLPDFERIAFYTSLVKWLGGILVGVLLWSARLEYSVQQNTDFRNHQAIIDAKQDERITANTSAVQAYITSDSLGNQSMISSVKSVQDRVNSLKDVQDVIAPQVHEMMFLKDHGISNRDDFFTRHGFEAPAGPENNIKH